MGMSIWMVSLRKHFRDLRKGPHEIKVQAATHDHDHLSASDTITAEVQ
jgi:hypothetical protein